MLNTANKRFFAVEFSHNKENSTLIVNMYMSCDKNYINVVNQEYGDATDEIEGLVSASQAYRIILCGDWNTAFERNNAKSKCLKKPVIIW